MLKSFRLWLRESRPTMRLALPIMGGMMSHTLISLVDTVMVGRVGVVPLAASTLVSAIAHLPLVFGVGLLSSIAVLTAQAFGANRTDETGELLRHGLVLSLITGIVAALFPIVCLRPVLHRLGQPPEVAEAAGPYLILFSVSLMPALVAHGCKQFSDALKHPWIPTLILLGGLGLTVLFNWILIYGNLGAPAMGLNGAGWATLLARFVVMVVMISYVMYARRLKEFRPPRYRAPLSWERFRGLLHLGWPVALQHLLEVGAFAFAALMMGWISVEAIAAHQIALTCASTTFMLALGVGLAASIRVGHAWGAGQRLRMRRIGFGGIVLAATMMGTFGILFMSAGRPIGALFIDSPAVVNLAAQLLIIAAIFQIVDGVQVVALSSLRGLSDVHVPALIAALAYWALALPLGSVLAFYFGMGAQGMWIGLASGLGAAAVLLTWRFHMKTA